jgi:hypothetical protein
MRFSYILVLLCWISLTSTEVLSQKDTTVTLKGDVRVIADSSITRLERGGRRVKELKGYRVQLYLGSLEQVKIERNKYLSLGLPYSAYMKQIVPEHALQIGDFITRMELDKCMKEIEPYYPKAFSVIDVIEPPRYGTTKPNR